MGAAQRKELREKHESLVRECEMLKRNLKEAQAAKDALEANVRGAREEQDELHSKQWEYLSEQIANVGRRFANQLENVVCGDLSKKDLNISVAAMLRDCKATEILVHVMTELLRAKFDSSAWVTSICFFCWRVLETYRVCRKLLEEHADGDAYFKWTLPQLDEYIKRIRDDMGTEPWQKNIFQMQLDIFSRDIEKHIRDLNDTDESIKFECSITQRLDYERLNVLKSFVTTVLKVYGRLSADTAVTVTNSGHEWVVVTITNLRKTGLMYQEHVDDEDAPPDGPSGKQQEKLAKKKRAKTKGKLEPVEEVGDENIESCLRAAHAVTCARCGRKTTL